MKEVSLKDDPVALQKTFTWTKKLGKRQHEWDKKCVEDGFLTCKLKMLVKFDLLQRLSYCKKPLNVLMELLSIIKNRFCTFKCAFLVP